MARRGRRRRSTLVPLTSLVVCLGVLIAAPTAWYLSRDAAPASQAAASNNSINDEVDSADDFDQQTTRSNEPTASSGSPASQQLPLPPQTPQPALFMAPSLGISTQIRAVGVSDDGQVAIPDDGDLVGWYRFGSAPGSSQGSSVIVGHRDTKAEGPGVLYSLSKIEIGQEIAVYRDDWSKVTYRVTSKQSVNKTVLPLRDLFATSGAPRLTVITCGGEYVKGRGYEENVVVTAVPTSA